VTFAIEHATSARLGAGSMAEIHRLCEAAYGTAMTSYFADIGPGEHLLGRLDGVLVSHLMWVTRWLEPEGARPLRTAYVELVATDPVHERRGFATRLLRHLVPLFDEYELAALSPATERLYLRLGWEYWRGPLAVRRDGALLPTPDERMMIRRLPRTPVLDLDAPLSIEWRPGEIW